MNQWTFCSPHLRLRVAEIRTHQINEAHQHQQGSSPYSIKKYKSWVSERSAFSSQRALESQQMKIDESLKHKSCHIVVILDTPHEKLTPSLKTINDGNFGSCNGATCNWLRHNITWWGLGAILVRSISRLHVTIWHGFVISLEASRRSKTSS